MKETVDAGTYTAIEKKLSDVKDGNLLTGDCKFQWIDKLVNEKRDQQEEQAAAEPV